jgi:predicted transcriptional regulator
MAKDRIRSIRLKAPTLAHLEKIGRRDERTVSWLIDKAIQQFLERDTKKDARV